MGRVTKPGEKRTIGAMTDQMRAFAWEYVIDFHGRNAAIRAGYSEKSATTHASKLLAREDVQEEIRKRMESLSKKTHKTAELVLEEAWNIATANVNDLVEFRRTCCRYCYGIDFGYQRTVSEMNQARRSYEKTKHAAISKDARLAVGYEDFDEQGGIGYDARKSPNCDCQECFGEGVGSAHFKDTRLLTPSALALYAGVKQTKEGFQMLTIDKNSALEKLFKHFGLYKVDNQQKADALGEFLALVQSRNGKLPIKPQ